MTLRDFKRRYLLSKCNPILFYIPGMNRKEQKKGRAIFSITPLTFVKLGTFTPYPKDNPEVVVPYYSFYTDKDDADICGSVTHYTTTVTSPEIPNLGCKYRIYKKVIEINSETGEEEIKYISVTAKGELDPLEVSPLFTNQERFNLPLGEYYYREYISGEGDTLLLDDLKIEIFVKDEEWQQSPKALINTIKDYQEEDLPEGKEIVYIWYKSLDDDKLHETFSGFKGYRKKYPHPNPEEEDEYIDFHYYLYHKPKTIKTYTKFEKVEQTYDRIVKNGYYEYSDLYYYPYTIGPMGREIPSEGVLGPENGYNLFSDQIIENNIIKIIPKVYKVKFMEKEIEVLNEQNISQDVSFNCLVNFVSNGQKFNPPPMPNRKYVYYERYKVFFPTISSHREIKIADTTVSNGYLMSYDQYPHNQYIHFKDVPFTCGSLYSLTSPSSTGSTDGDNHHTPEDSIGSGVAIQRSNLVMGDMDTPYEERPYAESIFTPVEVTSHFDTWLNGTICRLEVHNTPQPYKYTCSNSEKDEDKEFFIDDYGIGFGCAEDYSYFAMRSTKAVTKLDPDNPEGWSSFLCSGKDNGNPCFFKITAYEDENGNPKVVREEHYDFETGINAFDSQAVMKKKNEAMRDDYVVEYPYLQQVLDMDLREGCGVSVVYTRSTRKGYKEYLEVSEPLFNSNDNYTVND